MPVRVIPQQQNDPVVSGFDAMGSFLSGYIGQKRWEQEAAERRKRTVQLEREVGLREQEWKFKKSEHDRLLKREKDTQSAVVEMLSFLGEAARNPDKKGEWRANAVSQMFDISRNYPNADLGALATFGKDAADWLIPKDDISPKIWEEYDPVTGRTTAKIVDLNTGKPIHTLGIVDDKGYIQGTGMLPKDFYDIYTDLTDRYTKTIQDYYKDQIDVGKYLQGTPFMISDGTLDPESRLQQGRSLFAKMRADAIKEHGDFRTFALPKLTLALGGDAAAQKRAKSMLDAMGHVEIPPPKVTPQHYEELFRARLGEVGWSGGSYTEIKSFIEDITNPTEKAYAHQALATVMREFGDPAKPAPDTRVVPWHEMPIPEGISLGLNPPLTIQSDTQPGLQDFPSMLMQDLSKLTGILDVPVTELDPHVLFDPDARTFGRRGVPRGRPSQLYFDIRRDLQQMAPELFRGGDE